tara:strand:+ start:495 stop:839 length:345 start_codon:yes stop_codon:yes gene_type:complete
MTQYEGPEVRKVDEPFGDVTEKMRRNQYALNRVNGRGSNLLSNIAAASVIITVAGGLAAWTANYILPDIADNPEKYFNTGCFAATEEEEIKMLGRLGFRCAEAPKGYVHIRGKK